MTIPIVLLFLTDLCPARGVQPVLHKLLGKESGRATSESAVLSHIDDRDTFCKGNANAVFPDPYTYNVYYRCRRNRRETWKCIGDLYFDQKSERCVRMSLPQQLIALSPNLCHQQDDGLYPIYDTNCKHYVRCKGGMAIEEKQCGTTELFSYSLQTCRVSRDVTCIRTSCTADNDGFFVLPGSKCQAYYFCRQGRRHDFLCPKGQIFDIRTKICVDGGICYEPICVGRINGVYADTTHDCDRYFRCRGGELTEVNSCPRSLKYNGFSCAEAESVKCESPEKTAVVFYNFKNDECKTLGDGTHIVPGTDCTKIRVCEGGRTTGTSQCPINYRFSGNECYRKDTTECDELCSGKPDGYYPDEDKSCQEYYRCLNGKLRERNRCSNGTSFNGEVCSPSASVMCRNLRTREPCEGLRDGFHPDYLHGCRRYFYCHDRQTVLTKACPEGMKWNGNQCARDFLCEVPTPLPQCNDLITGVYPVLSSNCSNYVYCHDGLGTVLSCPNGEAHDGVRCRNRNEYTCPNEIHKECYNQPDGYRQDEESNCRSYFFCSRGNKITYICEDGFLFNGTQCVSSKQYVCPFHASDCKGKYDGYFPDVTSGCKKYFYCLNEKRITTFSCGGKKIFDGESCILVADAKAICAKTTSNRCRRRRDGKYSDTCDKYVECRRQTVVEERLCPRGTAFDGKNCSHHHSCIRKTESGDNCDKETVFIQDYESGCRRYYFCIGKVKMIATCPGGTIFNGKVCQDEKTYKCPTESDIRSP